MKKIFTYIFNYLSLVFMELMFMVLSFPSININSFLNIMLFMIPISIILTIITNLFKEKTNKILTFIIFFILSFWYSLYYIFNAIFNTQFSLSVLKLSNQGLQFIDMGLKEIFKNIYGLLILFLPFILLIIFRKKFNFKRLTNEFFYITIALFIISIIIFNININTYKDIKYSIYDLYYNINDNVLNIEKLGVLNATLIDLDRTIRGFKENIIISDNNDNNIEEEEKEEIIEYGYNELDLNLEKLINSNNSNIKEIASYLQSEEKTRKNKYTGLFKDKNLIYITAESFSEIAVDENLTPTLYKLVNSGFHFNNYYSSNNLSTIGGEFQSLTGLYADTSFLPIWKSGNNNFPYGLSTIFKNNGYNTYAYHDHYATFQDRNKYLKSMGFDNYLACFNGLEKRMNCNLWPNSDIEMIRATINDYLNSDKPFLAYYMTVSGHFEYNFGGNQMAKKNKKIVDNLPYSEKVKAYLATQIELDRALELLITELEKNNILDDTVIVLLADHYPYGLEVDEINELSSYNRDMVVEVNSNNLIIWNNQINHEEINKTCMSIDVIPTVYNLFGLDYDSRLFMGKDIFSDSLKLAFFSNRSFVTDEGTYLATTNKFSKDVSDEYINKINNIVANRKNISKLIIKTNFYKYLTK